MAGDNVTEAIENREPEAYSDIMNKHKRSHQTSLPQRKVANKFEHSQQLDNRSLVSNDGISGNFCHLSFWNTLEKRGTWKFDKRRKSIIGSGVFSYVVTRAAYGPSFTMRARLRFFDFEEFVTATSATVNSGIMLGYVRSHNGPTYSNLLFTGRTLLFESVDNRVYGNSLKTCIPSHLTDPFPFVINADNHYEIVVVVRPAILEIHINNKRVLKKVLPNPLTGSVGLRPWRCRIECDKFEIGEF